MGNPRADGFCFRILFGCLESQSELSWLFVDRDGLTSPWALDALGYARLSPALWLYAVLRLLSATRAVSALTVPGASRSS